MFPRFSPLSAGRLLVEQGGWQRGVGALVWCMVKKACFEKEKGALPGCGKAVSVGLHSVRANLGSAVCVKRGCAAAWLFLRAQVIGTEAAAAPESAVLERRGQYA